MGHWEHITNPFDFCVCPKGPCNTRHTPQRCDDPATNTQNTMGQLIVEKGWKQRVILDAKDSTRADANSSVPQISVLCLLKLSMHIVNLLEALSSDFRLYADNTSVFSAIYDISTSIN